MYIAAIPVFIIGIGMGVWGIYVLVDNAIYMNALNRSNIAEFGEVIALHLRRGSWDPDSCNRERNK